MGVWDVNTLRTQAMMEAAIIVPRFGLGRNLIQIAKSRSTGTENPLN